MSESKGGHRVRETGSLPTSGNTWAETSFRVLTDYLEFSVWGQSVGDLAQVLCEYIPGEFVPVARGMLGYERQLVGPGGAKVLSSAVRPEVHVVLPGQWCGALPVERRLEFLVWVLANGKPSRVDLAGDDYQKLMMPRDLWQAVQRGECVSHTRTRGLTQKWQGGETMTFGARGSRQYLRVYDKDKESDGEVPAIRWELETRKEAAQSLLVQLVAQYGNWGELFASRLVQFVDFRAVGLADVTARPRLDWFTALVGEARKALVYGVVAIRTLEQVRAWIERQVAPSLAVCVRAAGGDLGYLTELVEHGRARWRAGHRELLASAGLDLG